MKKMKEKYDIKSERYGYTHSFVRVEPGKYIFVAEKKWMPIRVSYDTDGAIRFIDPDGGPCIGVGFKTNEVEVVSIERDKEYYEIFTLKEIENE